jgi:hypothetical protein
MNANAGPDGFIDLRTLREEVRTASVAEVARFCALPAIVIGAPVAGQASESRIDTPSRELPVGKSVSPRQRGATGRQGRLAILAKRQKNPFADMVSLGRALNNDIVLALPSVSKMHGYFRKSGDGWTFTDPSSKNGSFVNGERLAHGVARPLADGDVLQFGNDVLATFVSPERLRSRLADGVFEDAIPPELPSARPPADPQKDTFIIE